MNLLKKVRPLFTRKVNTQSYRSKYLMYYLLTCLIPIMVIIIFSVITQGIIKNQFMDSNAKTLKQFLRLMDEKVSEMSKDAYEISLNQDLQKIASIESKNFAEATSSKISILEMLYDYKIKNNYYDVFVWFSSNDLVLSGKNPVSYSTDLVKYNELYYPYDELFKDNIHKIANRTTTTPTCWSINENQLQQSFCISLNRYKTIIKGLPNYTVSIIIDYDFWEKIFSEVVLSPNENIIIFDTDGNSLFSYQSGEITSLPEEYLHSGIYEINENKQKYTLLLQKSSVIEGYYAMTISQDAFYKPLLLVQTVTYTGIFISIMVGIYITRKMIRNTYRPLEFIVSKFQDTMNQQFDPLVQNEFEFISNLIPTKGQTQKDHDNLLRKRLLLVILDGKEINESALTFLKEQVSSAQYFFGSILNLKHCGDVGWEQINNIVLNEFSGIFADFLRCDIIPLSSTRFVIILMSNREENDNYILSLLKKGLDFLQTNFNIDAVIGTTSGFNEIWSLHNMFYESQQALMYDFVMEAQAIIHYNDIKERKLSLPFTDGNTTYYLMNDFLQGEPSSEKDIASFIEHLTNTYAINNQAAIETIDYFRYEILNTLNRIWANYNVEYFRRQKNINSLTAASCLSQYLANLTHILHETKNDLQDEKSTRNHTKQVKKYVDANYSNPDLCISSLGEAFNMQPAYLSKLFRTEYTDSLLNYISIVRITHAKEMLTETNMTINDIADATGFLSSGIFIKTFKKITGTTPGKYRTANKEMK